MNRLDGAGVKIRASESAIDEGWPRILSRYPFVFPIDRRLADHMTRRLLTGSDNSKPETFAAPSRNRTRQDFDFFPTANQAFRTGSKVFEETRKAADGHRTARMLKVRPADQAETSVSPRVSGQEALSPDSSSIHIKIFRSFSEVEAKWRNAQERCDCYGFQTFEWLSTWHETIGVAERIEPRIVQVADASGNTLMLLPLGIQRWLGLSFVTFLGGAVTDYNAPIIRADFAASLDGAAVDRLIARILKQLPKVDVIALERLPSVIDGVGNPLTRLPGARHVSNAWVATLGDTFADFKKRRSAKLFRDAGRRQRRLSEIAATSLCIADTPDTVAEIMRVWVRQKRRRLRELGAPDRLAVPGYLRFYSTMAECHFNSGLIQTSALRVGETVVATHWGMVFRNRYYWLMPTYEAGAWTRFSVGRLLMQSVVEWSISQGIEWFDLTIGDEPFKREWADRTLPLHEYIRGLTAMGKAYWQACLIGRQIKSWAEQSESLRRIVRIWRRRRTFRLVAGKEDRLEEARTSHGMQQSRRS